MMFSFNKLTAASLALLCLGFTSCGDDDPEPAPNPGTGTETETPVGGKADPSTVFTQGVPSQVGDLVITTNANGLVTKIVDGDQVTSFDYTPAASKGRAAVNIPTGYDMTMNVEWGEDEDGVDFYITLNSMGYIAYAYEVDEDRYGGATAEEWWFTYDDEGHLIEMKRTEGDNEVTTITYNADGDIVKVLLKDDVDGYKDETEISYTTDSQTSPILNKGGIMLYDASFCIDMDEMAPAFYAGLLGKGTMHLPAAATEKDLSADESDSRTDFYTFTWELNAAGLPVKFSSTYSNLWGTFDEDPIIFRW